MTPQPCNIHIIVARPCPDHLSEIRAYCDRSAPQFYYHVAQQIYYQIINPFQEQHIMEHPVFDRSTLLYCTSFYYHCKVASFLAVKSDKS